MTEASMLLEARTLARRKSCYALKCLLRLRGAPAIASFLLLLPAARAAAAAASSTARVLVLREALRDSIAFQNALSLGSSSGALSARRGGHAGRNRQHHSCPLLQRNEATKWVVASPRRASVSLEDAAREEDVMGSPRVSGKDVGEENSDGSERRAAADDDGGSDAGEGGSSEGRAVVAADILVAMDDSLEERPLEGAVIVPPEDVETEVAGFEFAPAMTVRKFETMQDRRVPVAIKYSGGGGFKRYFEEIATVLKRHFPDVLIDREIVEVSSTREEKVFEIRVDGKLVCTKRRGKPGVFLHMETFAQAIRKARQRRRPGSIVYGDQDTYQNVKALTDERTASGFLEKDFQDLPDAGDMSKGASQGGETAQTTGS